MSNILNKTQKTQTFTLEGNYNHMLGGQTTLLVKTKILFGHSDQFKELMSNFHNYHIQKAFTFFMVIFGLQTDEQLPSN